MFSLDFDPVMEGPDVSQNFELSKIFRSLSLVPGKPEILSFALRYAAWHRLDSEEIVHSCWKLKKLYAILVEMYSVSWHLVP